MKFEINFFYISKYMDFLKHNLPFLENKLTFEDLSKKLINPKIEKDMLKVIELFELSVTEHRVLLTSFMIIWFSDEVMAYSSDEEKKDLIKKSKDFLNELYISLRTGRVTPVLDLKSKIFAVTLKFWKNKDENEWRRDLIKMYQSTQQSIHFIDEKMDNELKHVWLRDLANLKTNIKDKLKILKFDIININDIVEEEKHRLYWEKMNVGEMINIISEIRERFIKLQPKFKNDIDELIDIDFITQMINHNLNQQDLINIFKNIIGCFHLYQSPSEDKELDKFAEKIMEELNLENIPKYLNIILIRLDKLEDKIKRYKRILIQET